MGLKGVTTAITLYINEEVKKTLIKRTGMFLATSLVSYSIIKSILADTLAHYTYNHQTKPDVNIFPDGPHVSMSVSLGHSLHNHTHNSIDIFIIYIE